MAHPYQKYREHHPGRARVKRILKADGGGLAGRLADEATDAKSDLEGTMRYGADQISNNSNIEKPSVYMARRRMKGDDPFKGIK